MTARSTLGRQAEKALYVGGIAAVTVLGLAVAVTAALGLMRAALALLGLTLVAGAALVPLHEMRLKRFLSVGFRRTGTGGGSHAAPRASAAATVEVGQETMAALARLNRQVTSLAEQVQAGAVARPVTHDAASRQADDAAAREIALLRAELRHALVGRPTEGGAHEAGR